VVSAIREHSVQRCPEVFGLGAKGFVVEIDFQLTFSFLVVEIDDSVFVELSFSFQVWRYLPIISMFFLSTAFPSPSARMISRSSEYAYFLEHRLASHRFGC